MRQPPENSSWRTPEVSACETEAMQDLAGAGLRIVSAGIAVVAPGVGNCLVVVVLFGGRRWPSPPCAARGRHRARNRARCGAREQPPARAKRRARLGGRGTSPSSGSRRPRMRSNMVLLPTPLRPTTPALWPGCTVTSSSSNRARSPRLRTTRLICSMVLFCQPRHGCGQWMGGVPPKETFAVKPLATLGIWPQPLGQSGEA